MRTQDEVKHAFTPVGGLSPTATMKLMKIQAAFKECAEQVLDLVPESADRTFCMRQLLDCKFWAVQAITHELPPVKKPVPGRPHMEPRPNPTGGSVAASPPGPPPSAISETNSAVSDGSGN